MGLAFYSTMLDARCEGIEDAADLHAGHLLFHTNRKKGESHSTSFFFFYSNWVSFSFFHCKTGKQCRNLYSIIVERDTCETHFSVVRCGFS